MVTDIKIEVEAVYTIWLREFKRYFRAKERIIGSMAMPLFWFLIFGMGLGSSISFTGVDVNYFSFLVPGIISMSILFTSLFSGVSVIWDREFGFLKEMLVAPISRISIVIGKALGGATTALIQSFLILAIAVIFGWSLSVSFLLLFIPLVLIISIGFVSLGLTIASLMQSIEGFQLIMNFIVMPMFFLSGALFPLNSLPEWLRFVTYIDPLMYGVEILRFISIGFSSFNPLISLAVVILFSSAMSLLGAYTFSKQD